MSRLLQLGQVARLTRGPSAFAARSSSIVVFRGTVLPLSRIPNRVPSAPIGCRGRYYSTNGPKPPPGNQKNQPEDKSNNTKNKEGDIVKKEGKTNDSKEAEDPEFEAIDVATIPNFDLLTPKEQKILREFVRLSDKDMKAFKHSVDVFPGAILGSLGQGQIAQFEKYGVHKDMMKLMRDVTVRKTMPKARLVLRAVRNTADGIAALESLEDREKGKKQDGQKAPVGKEAETEQQRQKQEQPQGEQQDKEGSGSGSGSDSGGAGGSPAPFQFGNFSRFDLLALIVLLFFISPLLDGLLFGEKREITWQEVRRLFLDKGLVERFVVREGRVDVQLNREATRAIYDSHQTINPNVQYYFTIGSVEAFENRLDGAQNDLGIPPSERIPVKYGGKSPWLTLLLGFGPTLLLVGLLAYSSRQIGNRAGSQMFGFGKSRAKKFNHETGIKVKFSDVAGMDEAKVEIMEFVSFLKTPEKFRRLGAKIPRGAILAGPPGTGKTLLAKATAGECQVPFFSVSGSEFVEMFVGVGPSRVRDLFATARKNAPCIIFIDEIDAIGRARADSKMGGGGNDEREATLNQILTEMDGFNTTDQVVVLAGTNRADVLDKALLRPGRFDRHIFIDRPTQKGREEIFKVHLAKIVTKEDKDRLVGRLATLTPGFSGADIAHVVNEAALIAARGNAETVLLSHFEQAIERTIGGLERKSLVLRPEEKKTVAYHEAGHAICGWYLKDADPLLKVSIIPRGQGALGYAQYLPQDAYLMSTNQLMDRMAMTLGGRISEELHFETVTTGASDDFKKVTHLATSMVTQWGMSEKVGPLHFEDGNNQRFHKPFAEDTGRKIDAEVRRIVEEAYKVAKDLLTARKAEVGLVAEELLKKEVLTRDDLVRILGPRPFASHHQDFEKYFGGKGANPPTPFPSEETDTPPSEPFQEPPPPAKS